MEIGYQHKERGVTQAALSVVSSEVIWILDYNQEVKWSMEGAIMLEIIITSEKHAIGSQLLRGMISAENAKLWQHFSVRVWLRAHPADLTWGGGTFVFSLPSFQDVHFPRRYTAVQFQWLRENLGRKVETALSSRFLVYIPSWFSFAV